MLPKTMKPKSSDQKEVTKRNRSNLTQIKFMTNYMKQMKKLAQDLFDTDVKRLEAWKQFAMVMNTLKAEGQEDKSIAQWQQTWKDKYRPILDKVEDIKAGRLSAEGVVWDEQELAILEAFDISVPVKKRTADAAGLDNLGASTSKKGKGNGQDENTATGMEGQVQSGTIVRYLDHILKKLLDTGRVQEHRYVIAKDLHDEAQLLRGSVDRLTTQVQALNTTMDKFGAVNIPVVD